MGLTAAAMSVLPAAAVLCPTASPFLFSSCAARSASALVRLSGWSRRIVVRGAFSACGSGSASPSAAPTSLSSSSSLSLAAAAVAGDSSCNFSSALRGRRRGFPSWGLQTRSSFRDFATMSTELMESVANNPGLHEKPDEATKGYFLQQTMYRIKDPKISLDFYTRILGMSLLKRFDFPENKFSLYFLGYEDVEGAPTDPSERVAWTFGKIGTLELTHNWGTESDENFKGHHNGNSDPRGYGHIGVTVDDTYKACERFEKLGVKFVKKPDDGKMKGLAFIQDPDGYWIEIFDIRNMSLISAQP